MDIGGCGCFDMSKIYVGENPISAVFMGGKRYGVRVGYDRLLPVGYTQLEYIEATGTQYIDTGIAARYTIGLKVNFQTEQNMGANLCQAYDSTSGFQVLSLITTSLDNSNVFAGGFDVGPHTSVRWSAYGGYDSNRHTLDFNVHGDYAVLFDDVGVTVLPPINSDDGITLKMPIFASNRNGNINELAKMKLYFCSMYDSGILVRDFIPAKRDSDNKIGLYDTVSKAFFADVNGGNFVGGDPV